MSTFLEMSKYVKIIYCIEYSMNSTFALQGTKKLRNKMTSEPVVL